MRYQTSSMRRKAKPTRAAAARTNVGRVLNPSTATEWPPSAADGLENPSHVADRAITPTNRFTSTATNSVRRLPKTSSMKNVEVSVPATAPSVFTP